MSAALSAGSRRLVGGQRVGRLFQSARAMADKKDCALGGPSGRKSTREALLELKKPLGEPAGRKTLQMIRAADNAVRSLQASTC